MPAFVYDGTAPAAPDHIQVVGATFRTAMPVEVSERQALKLRRLPFFFEVIPAPVDGPDFDVDVVDDEPPSAEAQPAKALKRKRGRPPGSKNKPKVMTDGNENAG